MRYILEYIWLDGYKTQNLRSKVKVVDTLDDIPRWNFDGSSTEQAPGDNSECILEPVRTYQKDGSNHIYVLCEVLNPDGSAHTTNSRARLREMQSSFEQDEFWWGFEQEYFITKNFIPLGFPKEGFYPRPQGLYYCGVGTNQVVGRELVMEHLQECLDFGIKLTGINAEVAVGQWEYQCFAEDTLKACDDLWFSRYLLYKMAEKYGWDIDISPKPVSGDWNGSGCHTNFSTNWMRSGERGEQGIRSLMANFAKWHDQHIKNYGESNEHRLTGAHETQHIGIFSWGVADRGASIRIPSAMPENDWKGYIEDRRPAANCDPYKVARVIVKSSRSK